jgi:PAT family beta-lactamase induction signal transducer AmpG
VTDADPRETRRNILRTLVLLALGVGGFFLLNAILRLTLNFVGPLVQSATGFDPKGWILPPDNKILIGTLSLSFGAVGTELFQLAVCAVLVGAAYVGAKRLIRGTPMADALVSFVRQPGFPAIFFFILFYRFGEAMVVKMSPLFLKDSIANGGLAVSNEQLGIIKGFIGVVGIILGGLTGGWVVSKFGLRKAFFPIAFLMHMPNVLYAFAAWRGANLPLAVLPLGPLGPVPMTLAGIDFAEQFGYGFGFAGYMVYLMWVAQRGKYKTTHYAIGTGMGALCIAIAGAVSGVLQANFGYTGFFVSALFLALPGLLSLLFIPLDADEGRGSKVATAGGH